MLYLIKFIILLTSSIFVCLHSKSPDFIPYCISELLLIFSLTGMVSIRYRRTGYIIGVMLLLVYSAQMFIYYFCGEFISSLMLQNINMMSNLGNELTTYILTAIPFLAILFLPWKETSIFSNRYIASAGLCIYIAAAVIWSSSASMPKSPFIHIGDKISMILHMHARIQDEKHFVRDSIPGSDKVISPSLTDKPNIILMLSEGLSAEVLDIYNELDLNLTPNLNKFSKESIVFNNYFNHTAATFRAVRGQLYSGFQKQGGYDQNNQGLGQQSVEDIRNRTSVSASSLIDIVKSFGYKTCFVNPEPGKPQVIEYMKSIGLEEFSSGDTGNLSDRTDKEIFTILYNTLQKFNNSPQPYFILFYNLGTHHGFDSPDITYGDGKNPYLNKFHNYDTWFGDFFNKSQTSGLLKNTVLIFTADHASYPAPEFKSTFNSNQSTFIAKIPLFIYAEGVTPEVINANGRNSLDITPTIADILNIEENQNYFLGTSLFREDPKPYSRVCTIGYDGIFVINENHQVEQINFKTPIAREIRSYYNIAINGK